MREGSLALGASQDPNDSDRDGSRCASKGLLTGMILGVARVAGETAPLLFTGAQQSILGRKDSANQPRLFR